MTGTTWQNYTAPPDGVAADDTLLELNKADISANADGTVHEATVAAVVQAGLGFTTAGDTVYGGSSGVPVRLAGNTAATRKFLRQTGTGSASAAPAWDTIVAGDLPAATTGAQGAVQLDGTATDILALGTQAAGSSGFAADAKHVHPTTGLMTNPMTTAGDLVIGGTSGTPARLAAGTANYVLTSNGVAAAPSWKTAGGGSTPLPFTYIAPSGDTSGAADTAAINAVISAGGNAVLAQTGTGTPYYVNAPLTPSTGASLRGAMPWSASSYDAYSAAGGGAVGGTVIKAVAGFTGTAVITMTNATTTQYYGVVLQDFTVDCSAVTSTAVEGMHVEGGWGACFMAGVMIYNPGAWCLHMLANATTNYTPDDWHVFRCKFSAGYNTSTTEVPSGGVYLDNVPDSWFSDCEASESQGDNWLIAYSLNTHLTSCKAENSNGGAGFHFIGQGGTGETISAVNCTTHLNNQDGFLFDNAADGSSGAYYQLSNCAAVNDNQAGGTTYAGFRSNGSLSAVMASNCYSYGSYYGASQASTTGGMTFTSCALAGTSAATHDDGSGTNRLISNAPVGTALSGGGFSNPMTTSGDTIYGGTSGGGTRLAGNTAATKKFLTQTGSGSASAAPGWNTIAAADVPQLADYAPTGLTGAVQAARFAGGTTSGAPTTGTFAVGDYVVDQSGTMWICTTAGSPGTWVALLNTSAAQTVAGAKTFTGGMILKSASGNALVLSSDGTLTSAGAMWFNPSAGHASALNLLNETSGTTFALMSEVASAPAGVAALGGFGSSWVVAGPTSGTGASILQVSNSDGTQELRIQDDGGVSTANNTVDDGSGNAAIGGALTVGSGTAVAEQFVILSASYTGSNATGAQKVFNASATGAIALAAGTTYEFEALYNIATSGATSHQLGVSFGGTATLTSIAYQAMSTNGTSAAASAPSVTFAAVATNTYVTAAVAAATNNTVLLKGTVRVNAAGTFIPEFQYSAAPGAAPVVAANSYFKLAPLGSNTVTTAGTWS